jgi:hypothetical protein
MKRVIAGIAVAALLAAGQASATAPRVADRLGSQESAESSAFMGLSPMYIVLLAAILAIAIATESSNSSDTPASP